MKSISPRWVRSGDELDKSALDFVLKKGNSVVTLPAEEQERWVKAVRPLLDDYVNRMKAKGLPGDEALKFCLERLKALQ